jgi:predicted nuclease of restriction endonuclease-like (RecB) superfamily
MSVTNPTQRKYYELLTIKTILSVRELKRQIDTLAYERTGLSKNKELSLEQIQNSIVPQTAEDAIKDIYVFEFLGLDTKEVVTENDLETALIQHLQEFILELGNGFCFEARQKRILIGDDYFFIDLVFYHRILKCHVLIELKIDKMHVGHIAQLKTYLNYYDKEIKLEDDNAPIGILLVTDKNDTLIKYALPEKQSELFISKYKLQLPSEQQLLDFIEKEIKKIGNYLGICLLVTNLLFLSYGFNFNE